MREKKRRKERFRNGLYFLAKAAVLIAVIVALNGCLKIETTAPPGAQITLAPPGAQCQKKTSKRLWYALWGVAPIGKNDTTELLREVNGPVKIVTKFTPLDVVIAFFTSAISIVPKTVEIYTCQAPERKKVKEQKGDEKQRGKKK